MPYSFRLVPENAFFLVTCYGVVTESDLYDFRATVIGQPRLNQATKRLYDARQVTATTFSPFTFWRLLSMEKPQRGMRRAFILPNKRLAKLIYRIALKLARNGHGSRICYDADEALQWLELKPEDVFEKKSAKSITTIGNMP